VVLLVRRLSFQELLTTPRWIFKIQFIFWASSDLKLFHVSETYRGCKSPRVRGGTFSPKGQKSSPRNIDCYSASWRYNNQYSLARTFTPLARTFCALGEDIPPLTGGLLHPLYTWLITVRPPFYDSDHAGMPVGKFGIIASRFLYIPNFPAGIPGWSLCPIVRCYKTEV
jgi:hypothetical protein